MRLVDNQQDNIRAFRAAGVEVDDDNDPARKTFHLKGIHHKNLFRIVHGAGVAFAPVVSKGLENGGPLLMDWPEMPCHLSRYFTCT